MVSPHTITNGNWIDSETGGKNWKIGESGGRVDAQIGMRLLPVQTLPILSVFGPPQPARARPRPLLEQQLPWRALQWDSLTFPSPFPPTPVDCCPCLGPYRGCLHGNDYLANWESVRCGLGEGDNPGLLYTNFTHIHTYILHTDITHTPHPTPSPAS